MKIEIKIIWKRKNKKGEDLLSVKLYDEGINIPRNYYYFYRIFIFEKFKMIRNY